MNWVPMLAARRLGASFPTLAIAIRTAALVLPGFAAISVHLALLVMPWTAIPRPGGVGARRLVSITRLASSAVFRAAQAARCGLAEAISYRRAAWQ